LTIFASNFPAGIANKISYLCDLYNPGMPALTRPQKITFGDMRESGVRGVLVYC
jgi:hypothetical protein